MENTKRKYSSAIEVQEIDDGVILHLTQTADLWDGCMSVLTLVTMILILMYFPQLAEIFNAEKLFLFCGGLLVVSIIFVWGLGIRERRIILDADNIRFERRNAFRIQASVMVERVNVANVGVFYLKGNHVGYVRIVHKDGDYTHLIEESGENCQKIADVLNHNLHWMKQ